MRSSARRYLGLELAGAKNQKTAVAALEYYPREQKIFLLDVYDRISPQESQTGDEALLSLIDELSDDVVLMGVNVPLELPPCITCTKKSCTQPSKCSAPGAKWMREFTKKMQKSGGHGKVLEATPYTQRPVEIWMRYQVLPDLAEHARFEIDEALGGNKAPLTARMNFLKRHLGKLELVEVWPKLSVAKFSEALELPKRVISSYRHLEDGVYARTDILEALARDYGIFIYERDVRKLAQSLAAFDAFICAFTALLSDRGDCVKVPNGFPSSAGWVAYPG